MKIPRLIKKIAYKFIDAQNQKILASNEQLYRKLNDVENLTNLKTNNLSGNLDVLNAKIDIVNSKLDAYASHQDLRFWQLYKKQGESLNKAKKRFFLSLHTSDPYMKLKQDGDLEILRRVVMICNKHKLKYWITYGTLLGAIRHNSFVPWDDDVDIAMPINDFNKLTKILDNDKVIRIEYQYMPDCMKKLAKVVFRRYTSLWYIDIFLQVPITANRERAESIYKKLWFQSIDEIKSNPIYPTVKGLMLYNIDTPKNIVNIFENIVGKYRKAYFKKINKISTDNEKCIYSYDMGCAVIESDYYFAYYDDIFPLKKAKFCDISVSIPNKYHKLLEIFYKDYYSLPTDIIWHVHNKGSLTQEQINKKYALLKKISANHN